MTYTYDVKAAFNLDQIELITEFRAGDKVLDVQRQVINLHEQAVKDALVKLGWTPPEETARIKLINAHNAEQMLHGVAHSNGLQDKLVALLTLVHQGLDPVEQFGSIDEALNGATEALEQAQKYTLHVCEANDTLAGQLRALRDASSAFLQSYRDLVACGDCGNWDPDKAPEVIALVAALEASK